MSDTTPRAAGAVSEHSTATTDQFSLLRGAVTGKFQLWCNACGTGTELTKSDPHEVTAEAALLKRQHDPVTCGENRGKPEHARQWSGDAGADGSVPTEGAG